MSAKADSDLLVALSRGHVIGMQALEALLSPSETRRPPFAEYWHIHGARSQPG